MDDNGNFGNLLIIGIIVLLLVIVMTYVLIPKDKSYALFSDEVEGVKTIELYYSEDNNSTGALYLINNMVGKNGFEKVSLKIGDNAQIKTKELVDYRYRGSNDKVTNNYVKFNNEIYRIIGVFPTEDEKGSVKYSIKIIKDSSYKESAYDNKSNNFNNSFISDELNNAFYNTIEDSYKDLILNSVFYLGGYTNLNITKEEMFNYERKDKNDEDIYFSKPHENTNKSINKIGLLYASDYAYATTCDERLNRLSIDECKNNNWLYKGNNYWLLDQNSNEDANNGFIIRDNGDIWTSNVNVPQTYVLNKYNIYPVFYLKFDVKIKTGDGSKTNPYEFIK